MRLEILDTSNLAMQEVEEMVTCDIERWSTVRLKSDREGWSENPRFGKRYERRYSEYWFIGDTMRTWTECPGLTLQLTGTRHGRRRLCDPGTQLARSATTVGDDLGFRNQDHDPDTDYQWPHIYTVLFYNQTVEASSYVPVYQSSRCSASALVRFAVRM